MIVQGIGVLFSRGRGIEAFRRALHEGWREPSAVTVKGRTLPAYLVDLERIQDRAILKKLRRSDKLSKMAVLAASDAVAESGLEDDERRKLGVVVATAYGAHATTFEFLDGILDYGEAAVSPTVFSNSVHNAAASYISSALGIQGPTLTVTQFFFSFQAALQLADAWLQEGRVRHVLVGAVDQFGEVMGYIADQKLSLAADGKIRPFLLQNPAAVPGEGAAFFLLGNEKRDRAYCRVEDVRITDDGRGPSRSDLIIIDADGLLPDETCYQEALDGRTMSVAYSPLWGSMMIGSAFSVAAGALMLKDSLIFPNPVPGDARRPVGIEEPRESSVEFIRCIRYNCCGVKVEALLRRAEAP
jgi:3-oxoacyl-[acyl-carrier-protein] synthase II